MTPSKSSFFSIYDGPSAQGVVTTSIYINDSLLTTKSLLDSIWIRKEVNKIGKAEIVFKVWSSSTTEETESEENAFTPGNKIRIEVGYLNGESEASLFEGIIVEQDIDLEIRGSSRIKLGCRDHMYLSTIAKKTSIYTKVKDQSLLSNILSTYKEVKASVSQTKYEYQAITQYNNTDWDFILERAKRNGLVVQTEGSTVTIGEPSISSKPVFNLSLKDNIIDIKGQLKVKKQFTSVKALGWNQKEQKLETVTVANDSVKTNNQGDISSKDLAQALGNNELVLQTSDFYNRETLQKWAQSQMTFSMLQRISGEVSCKGTAAIKHGCIVEISGVNRHMDGNAYCGAVEHEVKNGNWNTKAIIGFDYRFDEEDELDKSISAIQIGKVSQIDEDPTKEFNIQVEIPLFKAAEVNKIWARRATFWSSNGYGSFFIPDVGDEVIIGFLDSDHSHPVILGSLYSSKQSPNEVITKENYIKSLVTKEKLSLVFDDEKKSILLSTPAGNTVEINDEGKSISIKDQNENTIIMNQDGISIKSAKSISLEAKTAVTISAGTDISIKAKNGVNLKAMNIEAKADVGFTAKGSAKSELSAGGQTIIKGAMVMIN